MKKKPKAGEKTVKKTKKTQVKVKKVKIKKPAEPEWKTKPIGGVILEAGNSLKYLTGTWKTIRPITNYEKCIHCLKCIVYCPENCIKIKNDKKDHTEYQYCKGCGICAQVCPVKCIKMEDEHKFQK